jgi:hypothetical protein
MIIFLKSLLGCRKSKTQVYLVTTLNSHYNEPFLGMQPTTDVSVAMTTCVHEMLFFILHPQGQEVDAAFALNIVLI